MASKGSGRTVGRATLYIIPKLQGRLTDALGDIGTAGKVGGTQYGGAFNSGFKASLGGGAIVGAVSSLTTKALSAVTSHIGAAVSRLDTLKNYPTVMHSLGVNADEASASIGTMSERLSSLPTTLDSMSSTVQGIYAATKDYGVSLTTATNAGLALNDMLLAGGQGTQVTMSAMEQFRQMLSKGKPDMQDWKALLSAAPGQMDQLAKSMLGPTASANDLYTALGGGGSEATISMTQLLDAIVKVDTEGGAGLASFKTQAEDATGGIATSAANMGNAITKGLANVMDAFGRENIVSVLNGVKDDINGAFGIIKPIAAAVAPAVTGIAKSFVQIAPAAAAGGLAVQGLAKVLPKASSGLLTLASAAESNKILGLSSALGKASGVLAGPWGIAITAAAAGAAVFTAKMVELNKKEKDARTATVGVASAVNALAGASTDANSAIDIHGYKLKDFAKNAQDAYSKAASAHQRYIDAGKEAQSKIAEATSKVSSQNSAMEYAVRVIDAYSGKTNLTAAQQAEFTKAIETVNGALGTNYQVVDAASGKYADEAGNIQDSTDRLWDYVKAKEAANKADALGTAKQEIDKQQAAAVNEQQSDRTALSYSYQEVMGYVNMYGSLDAAIKSGDSAAQKAVQTYLSQAKALRDSNEAASSLRQSSDELAASQAALQARAEGSDLTIEQLAESSDVAMQAFMDGGSKASMSLVDFSTAIASCAGDADALKGAINDPETFAKIISSYDGTAESLHGIFDQLGIGFDEQQAKILDTQSTMAGFTEFLNGLSDGALGAISAMGESTDTLAAKLAGMGVSMSDLSAIGTDVFGAMVQSCDGDLNALADGIKDFNALGLDPKEFKVSDDGTIKDQSDNVWDFDQQTINGKHFEVNDDGTISIQSEGIDHVDAQTIADKPFVVSAGDSIDTANSGVDSVDENNISDKSFSVNVIDNASSVLSSIGEKLSGIAGDWYARITGVGGSGYATGGIRLNASGGVRYHADGGAIATRAVPLDIVGEAGAEAIVPLTNRRYSQPFADIIADEVSERVGGGTTNVYINGARINDRPEVEALLMEFLTGLRRLNALQGA
ncbi:MAG: tape measure protein [Collinsella sp.]|nr:tape measure protein [Collinsella sp.]MDY6149687.1 tape measure protein [Collinsella sp.]